MVIAESKPNFSIASLTSIQPDDHDFANSTEKRGNMTLQLCVMLLVGTPSLIANIMTIWEKLKQNRRP
jgi:hypothetical protein